MLPIQGLNAAFRPKWEQPDGYQPSVQVPEFTTEQVNPMWAPFLDALGASEPGGAKVGGALGGLQQAAPPAAKRLSPKYAAAAQANANRIAPGY